MQTTIVISIASFVSLVIVAAVFFKIGLDIGRRLSEGLSEADLRKIRDILDNTRSRVSDEKLEKINKLNEESRKKVRSELGKPAGDESEEDRDLDKDQSVQSVLHSS